jgi:DNA replication protein DnaC
MASQALQALTVTTPPASINGSLRTTGTGTGMAKVPLVSRHVRLLPKVHREMDRVDHGLQELLRALVEGRAKWPLFIHGAVGTGKTLAALCLADITRAASYATTESLCDEIMTNHNGGTQVLWHRVGEKDLAILDELGTRQNVSDLHYSAVKNFADKRAFEARGVAVYISNLGPNDLRRVYDDRLCSRILCGSWFHLDGKDRRLSR